MPDNILDDAEFVRQAMDSLGFTGDFAELSIGQMSLCLMVAARIKKAVSGEVES
jgi:hypothetical protein